MKEITDFIAWAKQNGAVKAKASKDGVLVEVEFALPSPELSAQYITDEYAAALKDMPPEEREALEKKRMDALLYGSS